MIIAFEKIVSSVLMKLDENEEILREKESYGIPGTELVDLIGELLEEVATEVILRAPASALIDSKDAEGEIEWEGPGRGSVSLPVDFLRLAYFRMSDWDRGVSDVVEYGSESYSLRFHPRRDRATVRTSPAVSVGGGRGMNILKFIGSRDPGAYVEQLRYIPVPSADMDGMVFIPERLVPAVTDSLAERVRGVREQTKLQ